LKKNEKKMKKEVEFVEMGKKKASEIKRAMCVILYEALVLGFPFI